MSFCSLLSTPRQRFVGPTFKKCEKVSSSCSNPGYWDINTNIYTTKLNDTLYIDGRNLIYIYEGRKPLLLRLSLRFGPTSVLWVSFLNEIHHIIWKNLKFATIIVFPYCKLLSFNMSLSSFHHCLKQVWVTELRCVSVRNLFFHRWTLHVPILNRLIINVPDL